MPLTRLCFILPADSDQSQPSKPPEKSDTARRIAAHARRSLHWFCTRRRHVLRCCFADNESRDSSRFEDTPGVDHKKRVGGATPRTFSYAELYIGTSGFSDAEVLGSGGFGRVYRAVLPGDGTVAAVKCVASGRGGVEKTFAAELAAVAQLRHRNLVRLLGWCVHEAQLLLVYDYMPNRSLDRLLFRPPQPGHPPPLAWERRRRIVSGLAAALFYLHEQLDAQIIHRDVKSSNVMLDSGYNARLGDFGLARWLEHRDDLGFSTRSASASNYQFRLTETSRTGGTIGYLPPESFQRRGTATAKSDVFSFGIVALEVATGRRAVDLAFPDDRIVMLDWVRRLSDEGNCLAAVDPRLPDGSYSLSEMRRLIHLGLLCSLHDPAARPNMKWVMEISSGDYSGELPALPSFQSHPQYISLSSTTTTQTSTGTATLSDFVTATGATVFLTADSGGSSSGRSNHELPTPLPNVDTPREIPFKEIVAITDNFSESRMVAELDFGTGYRGYLENRYHVLVKRLGMRTCPALRARFADELRNLGHLRHRHLVQLRGWCTEQGEMLVVYDYSADSLLSRHLFRPKPGGVLPWHRRYGIVKALASAVLYLHEQWDEQVIHRNITSSAVFLDADMNPRLGCFALAEFLSRNEHGHHRPASAARGIFGYMSPEYVESGEAAAAADVYSFGVVVLEVVSGMAAVDLRSPEGLLVRKARKRKAAAAEMADRRLEGRFDEAQLRRLVRLGMACTLSDPEARPSMRQIVAILDGNDGLLETTVESKKEEGREEWEERNASSLSLVRRMQALGIH